MQTNQKNDLITIILFFILMGIAFGAIQMSYNSALEFRAMRIRCEELDMLPLANGTVVPRPPTIPTNIYTIPNLPQS